jgi:hypothetical protein
MQKCLAMNNTPTYIASHVKDIGTGDTGEKRGVWTKIGAAWPNKDGKGFSVQLDVLPIDGRLMLREPQSDRDSAGTMPPSEV